MPNLLTDASQTFQEHHYFCDDSWTCRHCGREGGGDRSCDSWKCLACGKWQTDFTADELREQDESEAIALTMIRWMP